MGFEQGTTLLWDDISNHCTSATLYQILSVSRHNFSRHHLTSEWPLFLMCTTYDHWFNYFRPLAAYLCGKLGKCGVNTGSSHDNVKASLEVCHHCPIKNTHRHDMYSFTVSRFPIKTIFLVLTHTKNLLLAVSFIHKRLPLWLALHVWYGRLWQPVPFLTQP